MVEKLDESDEISFIIGGKRGERFSSSSLFEISLIKFIKIIEFLMVEYVDLLSIWMAFNKI